MVLLSSPVYTNPGTFSWLGFGDQVRHWLGSDNKDPLNWKLYKCDRTKWIGQS